jgi:hypothetical protein
MCRIYGNVYTALYINSKANQMHGPIKAEATRCPHTKAKEQKTAKLIQDGNEGMQVEILKVQ